MRIYYKEDKVSLKGKIRKSFSQNNLYDTDEKDRSCTLKVAAGCKVLELEADRSQTISFDEWVQKRGYAIGDEISFISATVKVKNKKIVRIYFSA